MELLINNVGNALIGGIFILLVVLGLTTSTPSYYPPPYYDHYTPRFRIERIIYLLLFLLLLITFLRIDVRTDASEDIKSENPPTKIEIPESQNNDAGYRESNADTILDEYEATTLQVDSTIRKVKEFIKTQQEREARLNQDSVVIENEIYFDSTSIHYVQVIYAPDHEKVLALCKKLSLQFKQYIWISKGEPYYRVLIGPFETADIARQFIKDYELPPGTFYKNCEEMELKLERY